MPKKCRSLAFGIAGALALGPVIAQADALTAMPSAGFEYRFGMGHKPPQLQLYFWQSFRDSTWPPAPTGHSLKLVELDISPNESVLRIGGMSLNPYLSAAESGTEGGMSTGKKVAIGLGVAAGVVVGLSLYAMHQFGEAFGDSFTEDDPSQPNNQQEPPRNCPTPTGLLCTP